MQNLRQDLETRGFLYQYTNEKVFDIYEKGGQSFYLGVDCSADSMTIGNFVALMMALHFAIRGNTLYLLVGGATSTIGNPSGKDDERPILSPDDLSRNQSGIEKQFKTLTKNISDITGKKIQVEIVNNYDFHKDFKILDFLREVGRYITVNWMISKDIVKKRITDRDKWISYAEFSYMLIMGYDFYHLYKNNGVKLEVGGSDEWDGILAGIEIIGKKTGDEVYGVTNKLIVDAQGKKFGKSEGNAIWLDKEKTSPYKMYQYFMNTLDDDIERYLKLFSFLEIEEIENISKTHAQKPEDRVGQKILAKTVVSMIHGEKDALLAEKISEFLFGENDKIQLLTQLTPDEFESICNEIGSISYGGQDLFPLFVASGLETSNSTARQSFQNKGLYINELPIEDSKTNISSLFGERKFLLLRRGKKQYKIVKR